MNETNLRLHNIKGIGVRERRMKLTTYMSSVKLEKKVPNPHIDMNGNNVEPRVRN